MGFNLPSLSAITPKVPEVNLGLPKLSDVVGQASGALGQMFGDLQSLTALPPSKDVNFPEQGANESATYYASNPFLAYATLDGTDLRKLYGYEFVISKDGVPLFYLPLPLAPSNISMDIPVATDVTVTMRGITEDHNAAPLRPINIQGTCGVQNIEEVSGASNNSSGILDYAFKNTIQSATRVVNQFNRVLSAAQGNPPKFNENINYPVSHDENGRFWRGSGYYFFHNLSRFFEFYLAIKKTAEGRKYRLHWHMYKDKMYYDVSLQRFSFNKQAGTVEYGYGINLLAYKRRKDPVGGNSRRVDVSTNVSRAAQLNILAAAINTIREARKLVSASKGILEGIRADVNETIFEPLRELILLGSDIASLVISVADLPASLINEVRQSITAAASDAGSQFKESIRLANERMKEAGLKGDDSSQSALQEEGIKNSQDGQSDLAQRPDGPGTINVMYGDPNAHIDILDNFSIPDLVLTDQARNKIEEEVARARRLTSDDFIEKRDAMSKYIADISASFGGGSTTYNRIHGLPAPKKVFRKLSVADIILLNQLNDMMIAMDHAISTLQQVEGTDDQDYFSFYQDYATQAGIPFQASTSKFYVPFPFGASLESLAVQYLGDANRWIEISALNGLRSPYIDEEGFEIPLSGSGSGSSVTINTSENLFIGQKVQVVSDTQRATTKTIASIDILSEVEVILSFEGEPDLGKYLTKDNARILAFLPNTVNSQNLIAIPSALPVNVTGKIKNQPGVEDLNGLVKIAKADFLLQSDGDLIFTSSGDIKVAVGLTNLVQAATMKLRTPLGSILQFPQFGNPIQVGASIAEFNNAVTLSNLNRMFLTDPRFSGILAGKVKVNGPAATIDLFLGIANTDVNLPISADLPI